MKTHFQVKHKAQTLKYEDLWQISDKERLAMKDIWIKRMAGVSKRTKKPTLVVSEGHHAQIPRGCGQFSLFVLITYSEFFQHLRCRRIGH
jgi:hypothetical protein